MKLKLIDVQVGRYVEEKEERERRKLTRSALMPDHRAFHDLRDRMKWMD